MDFLTVWLLLVATFSIALISPGPDFVLSLKNTLTHGWRIGVYTALGFAAGVLVHVTYVIFGFATLIMNHQYLFMAIKYAGAAYLLWLAVQALRSKGMAAVPVEAVQTAAISGALAFRQGFITNVLNPKATLFFVALFSQFLSAELSWLGQVLLGLTCAVMCGLWFSVLAVTMGLPAVRQKYFGISKWVDRLCGVAFIALALRLLTSEK